MKRAAILTAFDPDVCKGGIETFIQNLKSLLTERNINVDTHFIYPEPTLLVKPFPLRSLGKRIPEILLNCFMLGRAFSKIEKDYDLVISNNFYGLGYFAPKVKSFNVYHSTHAGYADALRGKIPDSDYRDLKYFYGHIGDRMSGRYKVKIAVSPAVGEELKRCYNFGKVSVVNHGIDTTFFKKIEATAPLRKKWDIPSSALVGIFVGRWEIGKGTDILEEVIKLHPDVIWLLAVGPSECPLAVHNTRVIKDADRESLKELYSLSDFMLLPSYYEGFGLAIVEAMACKLPVICTEVGVAKGLMELDAFRRLIIPSLEKIEMVREIDARVIFLRDNIHEKATVGNLGRLTIEKDYSLDEWRRNISVMFGLPN